MITKHKLKHSPNVFQVKLVAIAEMSMTSTNRIKILSSKPSLAFEDHQLRLLSDRSSLSQTDRPPHPQTKRPSIVSFNSQDFDFDDNCDPNSDSNSLGSDSTGNSHSSLFSLAVETQLENAKATLASLTGQLPQARHNIDQAKSQHALCERKVQRNEPQPANSMANFVTQWRSGTMIQRGDYKKKEEKDSEFARRRLLEAAEELLDANTQMDELNRQIAEAETEENNMEQLCNGLLVGNWEEIEVSE